MKDNDLAQTADGMASIPPKTAIRQIGSVLVARVRILSKFAADTILRELPYRLESEAGVTGCHKMVVLLEGEEQ